MGHHVGADVGQVGAEVYGVIAQSAPLQEARVQVAVAFPDTAWPMGGEVMEGQAGTAKGMRVKGGLEVPEALGATRLELVGRVDFGRHRQVVVRTRSAGSRGREGEGEFRGKKDVVGRGAAGSCRCPAFGPHRRLGRRLVRWRISPSYSPKTGSISPRRARRGHSLGK